MQASAPRDRLFFALYPDAETAEKMRALAETLRAKYGMRGKAIPDDRLHITLHHLGDYCGLPESLIATASAVAARISMPPFEVRLDCTASFPGGAGKRPCVLRSGAADANRELYALQHGLGESMHAAGLGRQVERRFTPHATLLYDERGMLAEAVPPIVWTVRSFALVHSLLGRGEHRTLFARQLL